MRRWPVVWVEDGPPSTYSMSCRRPSENSLVLRTPWSVLVAFAFMGLQHHRACAVTEQHAGGAVGPVQKARHGFRADQKHGVGLAAADEIVGHRQAIDEAGADRLHVEGRTMGHAQSRLHAGGGGGKGFVRRGGAADDRCRVRPHRCRRRPGRARRPAPGRMSFRPSLTNASLADAGALADPCVGRIHLLGEIVVGDDLLRQIGAAADNAAIGSCGNRARTPGAVGGDAGIDVGLGHGDGHVQRRGKAHGIGAAMAFHHHAVEAQKNAAIGSARIKPAAQRIERARGDEGADAGPTESVSSERRRNWPTSLAVPSAVFSAILPVKPSVTTTSTVPSAISSPSTKPWNAIGSRHWWRCAGSRRRLSPRRCPSALPRRH